MRYTLLLLLTALALQTSFAQSKVDEYLMQQEQLKKTMLLRELDSGVYFMDNSDYVTADAKFQYVLDHIKSVPSDLTFFFGKNSFFLGKYKQSIDWLNKYIQLKGTNGQYSQEAVQWQKRAETEYLKQKTQDPKVVGNILSKNYDIDCGPGAKVTCPVCKGEHVVVKKAAFGNTYKTCPYCDEHGWLTCAEYNQLLRGQLKPKNTEE
jgi:ssDNA-binding Zn-finger/Zn-ribbon topoisomerase 1